MGRRRRREADTQDTIGLEVSTGGGRARAQLLDPRAPMPQGDIKQVGGAAPQGDEVDKDELRARYRKFLAQYRQEIHKASLGSVDYQGDPLVNAMAATWGLPYAQAEREQYRLHAHMSEASKGASIGELLRRHGIGAEARAALVAHHANSVDPKVSLVAVKIANEMDEASADGAADSYEDWVALVMGGTD